jgi:hypothetical protein
MLWPKTLSLSQSLCDSHKITAKVNDRGRHDGASPKKVDSHTSRAQNQRRMFGWDLSPSDLSIYFATAVSSAGVDEPSSSTDMSPSGSSTIDTWLIPHLSLLLANALRIDLKSSFLQGYMTISAGRVASVMQEVVEMSLVDRGDARGGGCSPKLSNGRPPWPVLAYSPSFPALRVVADTATRRSPTLTPALSALDPGPTCEIPSSWFRGLGFWGFAFRVRG